MWRDIIIIIVIGVISGFIRIKIYLNVSSRLKNLDKINYHIILHTSLTCNQ
jgi:hypothetical protein